MMQPVQLQYVRDVEQGVDKRVRIVDGSGSIIVMGTLRGYQMLSPAVSRQGNHEVPTLIFDGGIFLPLNSYDLMSMRYRMEFVDG